MLKITDLSKYRVEPRQIAPAEEAVKVLNIQNGGPSINSSGRLPRWTLMENYLLTVIGSRRASEFYAETRAQLDQAGRLARRLGLGLTPMPHNEVGGDVKTVISHVTRDPETMYELEDVLVKETGWLTVKATGRGVLGTTAEHDRRLGTIYGYKRPCIENYVVTKGLNAPVLVQEAVRESNARINPDSFFAHGFCPCTPDDEEAAEIGRKFEEDLRKVAGWLGDAYAKEKQAHVEYFRTFDIKGWQAANRGVPH